jgi:NADH-quinone oxidoreductase subunit E
MYRAGAELLEAVKEHLELQPGETTPDKQWSLITTSCLGVCGVGPVLLVDEDMYGNVTPEHGPRHFGPLRVREAIR